MNGPLRLVLFDVDGTLVDSQASIVNAMTAAFDLARLAVPSRADILSIVGLSLDRAMAELVPDVAEDSRARLVQNYKDAYHDLRLAGGADHGSPLYPGAREMIAHLDAQPDTLLGVATGKSLRGLTALLEAHNLESVFVTRQVADHHPSKPHPSMILTAMAETGTDRVRTVMIGDTSFDMDMAQAAGVAGVGVSWGYHMPDRLGAAQQVIDGFDQLPNTLDTIWKANA